MQQILFEIPLPFGNARLPVFGFGLMLLLAILISGWFAQRRAEREGIDPDTFWDLGTWFILGGLIGCRVLAMILDGQHHDFWTLALQFFKVWEGGMVFYGLIPGAALAYVWVYYRLLKPKGIRTALLADIVAPSLALGLAIGRIGCLLNGCCYGDVVEPDSVPAWQTITFPGGSHPQRRAVAEGWQWGTGFVLAEWDAAPQQRAEDDREVQFVAADSPAAAAGLRPGDVIVRVNGQAVNDARQIHWALREAPSGAPLRVTVQRTDRTVLPRATQEAELVFDLPRSVPLHPSQIYSAIDASLLFLLAWWYYPLRRREGQVLALVMFVHGFSRFFLEKLRMDNPALAWGLTVSQWISLGLIAAGALLYLALWRWGRPVVGPQSRLVTHP